MVNLSIRENAEITPDDMIVYTLARDSVSQSEERNHDERRFLEKLDK
jgi:hypothetical protein